MNLPAKSKMTAPGYQTLLAGDVQLSFINPVAVGQHVKAGRLRALGVAGAKRSELTPEVPTMKEAGVEGVEVPLWFGLLAPAATPREIVKRMSDEVARIIKSDQTKAKLDAMGTFPVGSTPEEFDAFIAAETTKWGQVIKTAGVKAE